MQRLWIPLCLVIATVITASADERKQNSCTFQGQNIPCAVAGSVDTAQPIKLAPLQPADWEFVERDMARDATALHAEFLNNPTWEMAQRYALSQVYRQYRANQAMLMVGLARAKIEAAVKAKYGGDLSDNDLLQAIVIEMGMPVVVVPSVADVSEVLSEIYQGNK